MGLKQFSSSLFFKQILLAGSFIICFVFSLVSQNKTINNLSIIGNKKLDTTFIYKISVASIGKPLDSIMLEEDIVRLKRLPAVTNASYSVVKVTENKFDVIYLIEENFTIIPSANFYTTNNNEFAYRLGLYEFNLLGKNIILGGFFQNDNYNSFAVNFRAPYLFSNKFGAAINYQNLTTLEPVFFNNSSANYKYNNRSIEILGLHEINFNNRVELGINFFTEDYKYKEGITSPNVPQALKVNKWLIKFIYEYNKLDYHYQYINGFRSLLNLQYVSSTNAALPEFFIGWNDFFLFKRLGEKGNWANRMRVGLSTNDETPFAPFSVDNNLNVRGVGNTIDRGTGTIVLNTEYRYTLYERNWFVLQGNTFVDAGTWRKPGGDFSDFGKMENVKIYPGLGLRFIHKKIYNAIFRMDYGYGITKNATQGLVFGIGQYF